MTATDQKECRPAAAADGPPIHERYLPLGVSVQGLECLVVGGGRVGARKALTLAGAGGRVTVLAPEVSDRLRSAVEGEQVRWVRARYAADRLDGHRLVVAATSDPELNARIGSDAEARGALSCVVSPGRLSRVIFPAVHRADGVTVAVHSDGKDCAASRRVRDRVASALAPRTRRRVRFASHGARRADLSPEVFRTLSGRGAEALRREGFLVLATCGRWECYFADASPRAAARRVRRIVHERSGLMLEAHGAALKLRSDGGAFHHLLRVASGLDSPLVGETDVAGQVRAALEAWDGPADSPVADAFRAALRAQKRLRRDSGLELLDRGWAAATADLLDARLGGLPGRRVLLVGCGRLGERIAARLAEAEAEVMAFSRRWREGVEWCRRMGLSARAPGELASHVGSAGATVLTNEPPKGALEGAALVLDLTGAGGREGWLGLDDVGGAPLTGVEAARIAEAERLAYLAALRRTAGRAPRPAGPASIVIGARSSRLSTAQVGEAREALSIVAPDLEVNVRAMDAPCDRDRTTPLPAVREDDFFTRDLDAALLEGAIDLAVHSAKDLPSRLPEGLRVAALAPAFAPWDCLVTREGRPLAELPAGAAVGTSSDRRRGQLLALRADLEPRDVRGNVPDRLAQLDAGRYDALVLAVAGLVRLGEQGRIGRVFAPAEMAPAPGQGQLALVVRAEDKPLRRLLETLDLGAREGLPWA